jgi:putative addiction module CopG family antidote
MPGVEKISIALPPEMAANVRKAVETGEYASSSEVVRDALQEWMLKRDLRQHSLDGGKCRRTRLPGLRWMKFWSAWNASTRRWRMPPDSAHRSLQSC